MTKDLDFDGAVAKLLAAAGDGVRAALEVVGDASDRLVPVDEGDLRNSRRVTMDGDLAGDVSYGTDHARVIHERLDLHHPNGGQAKFLETALLSSAAHAGEVIAAAMRGAS